MIEQKQRISVNQTELTSFILSTTSANVVRSRTVINVIYVSGIVFMIAVFLILLWVNLCSRQCWCWHDTPLIHRFNRQWLLKRSITRKSNLSSNRTNRSTTPSQQDEMPLWNHIFRLNQNIRKRQIFFFFSSFRTDRVLFAVPFRVI